MHGAQPRARSKRSRTAASEAPMYLMREAILRSIEAIRGTAASEAPMYLMREAITLQEAIKEAID